jgi:hypothetical protein
MCGAQQCRWQCRLAVQVSWQWPVSIVRGEQGMVQPAACLACCVCWTRYAHATGGSPLGTQDVWHAKAKPAGQYMRGRQLKLAHVSR